MSLGESAEQQWCRDPKEEMRLWCPDELADNDEDWSDAPDFPNHLLPQYAQEAKNQEAEVYPELAENSDTWTKADYERAELIAADEEYIAVGYEPHPNDLDMALLHRGEFKEPEFLIYPLLPKGFITLLSGHGESFKSMLMLFLSLCVVIGKSIAGLTVNKGRVLYYSMEDDSNFMGSRLDKMSKHLALKAAELSGNLVVRDMTDAYPPYIAHYEQRERRCVWTADGEKLLADTASGYFDMVVIDNASEAFAGNSNSREEVAAFYARLKVAAAKGNCCLVIIAHVNRDTAKGGRGTENYAGSSQWHNGARSRIFLKRDEEAGKVEMRHEKCNVAPKLDKEIDGEFTGEDFILKIRTDAVVTKKRNMAALEAARHLLPLMLRLEERGEAMETGRNNFRAAVKNETTFPVSYTKGGADKWTDVFTAANLLVDEGLIRKKQKKEGTNTKERYYLTEAGKAAAIRLTSGGDLLVDDADTPF